MELSDIAKEIKESKENIFLMYAFNGTGKTRLSVEYKETARDSKTRFQTGVYYNAFSEDLFIWDNDTKNYEKDIKIQVVPSSLNRLHSQINEEDVLAKLKPYNPKYEFYFSYIDNDLEKGIEYIHFYLKDDESMMPIKISRGEERIFVWCFFWRYLIQKDGQINKINIFSLMTLYQALTTIIFLSQRSLYLISLKNIIRKESLSSRRIISALQRY